MLVQLLIALVCLLWTRPVQAQKVQPFVWTDYVVTTQPRAVQPMGEFAESMTANSVVPSGPLRMWWVIAENSTRETLQQINSDVVKMYVDHPDWQMGAITYSNQVSTLCVMSDFNTFLSCIRAAMLHWTPTTMQPSMWEGLGGIWTWISDERHGLHPPIIDDYDGVDIVVLVGDFVEEVHPPFKVRDCSPSQKKSIDSARCAAYDLKSHRRVDLITYCGQGSTCYAPRMWELSSIRKSVHVGGISLVDAVFVDTERRDSLVVVHLLNESVVSGTLPSYCSLGQIILGRASREEVVTCNLYRATRDAFSITFWVKVVPRMLQIWPGDTGATIASWEVLDGFDAYACPAEYRSYRRSVAQVLPATLWQIFLPSVSEGNSDLDGLLLPRACR